MSETKIDWRRYFDAIWCINYSPYTDRKEDMKRELERVGISRHDNFSFLHSFDNMFEKIVYDVTKGLNKNQCETRSIFNLSMAHYSCIKSSYESGCSRILILEDDIKMLEDLSVIRKYLDALTDEHDIVIFSHNPPDDASIERYLFDEAEGGIVAYDYVIFDAGMYSLNRKAMQSIITAYETMVFPADMFTTNKVKLEGIRRYRSGIPIAVQRSYEKQNNGNHMFSYANMNLNLEDYGLRYMDSDDETIRFKIIIPVWNADNTVKRCIDSIKMQEYRNYHVVLVDDMSTDSTVDIIRKEIDGDERFTLIQLDRKRNAGGARNAGIDFNEYESDYTLFLDSDDVFHSRYSISSVAMAINNSKDVDCVLCSFLDMKTEKVMWLKQNTVNEFVSVMPVYAPWTRCVKTSIVCRFDEEVSACDDVLQAFHQFERIKTITHVRNAVVDYMFDGRASVWRDDNMDLEKKRRLDESLMITVDKLTKEHFTDENVRKSALNNFVNRHIKEVSLIKMNKELEIKAENNKLCCINTVFHKPHMEWHEKKSLERMLSVLGSYDLVMTFPQGMDLHEYTEILKKYNKQNVKIRLCRRDIFTFYGYNHLMMIRPWFWEYFNDYEYVLTYELDAYVFNDELKSWCMKGYDFIGAPWYTDCRKPNLGFQGIGNGGFSLIRQKKAVEISKSLGNSDINANWELLFTVFNRNRMNLPTPEQSIPFSFELNPSDLFRRNGNKLPFGCHKWIGHEYDSFWSNYIKKDE